MLELEELKTKLISHKNELKELEEAYTLDKCTAEIKSLQEVSARPDFWDDPSESQKVLQKIRQLENKVNGFLSLACLYEDLLTLTQMAIEEDDESLVPEIKSEFTRFEETLEKLTLETLLTGEYDKNNAIISFHAGAGGTEAQDWALMLYRMYGKWGDSHGFKVKTLDYISGEEAGMKSAVVLIEGENAFGYLKSEMGVHRLVRMSPFDTTGRRHTSFSAIEVMPEITDDTEIEINPEDLKVDTYRSGGAGGQHVNKTESAIRITHIPTGIIVACQNERSQHQNREVAMRMLKSKLIEIKEREKLDRIEDIKGVQKKIEWGSQIRSYVFMPYTLVKDHRTGFESGNVGAVMDGDLDGFINAYLKAEATGNWAKK
ncbi:MAG: peptide chain release factor 2 [Clostridia bacterium]|nr:peptide chain release factor 2 [Clostridia bacterium]